MKKFSVFIWLVKLGKKWDILDSESYPIGINKLVCDKSVFIL